MATKTIQFLLRAPPLPPPSRLFSFRHCNFPSVYVSNKRFYAVKSTLEPPDVPRLAETARISLTAQEVVIAFRFLLHNRFVFQVFSLLTSSFCRLFCRLKNLHLKSDKLWIGILFYLYFYVCQINCMYICVSNVD